MEIWTQHIKLNIWDQFSACVRVSKDDAIHQSLGLRLGPGPQALGTGPNALGPWSQAPGLGLGPGPGSGAGPWARARAQAMAQARAPPWGPSPGPGPWGPWSPGALELWGLGPWTLEL